jgi:hypothetical protein
MYPHPGNYNSGHPGMSNENSVSDPKFCQIDGNLGQPFVVEGICPIKILMNAKFLWEFYRILLLTNWTIDVFWLMRWL